MKDEVQLFSFANGVFSGLQASSIKDRVLVHTSLTGNALRPKAVRD
jgi:hypothetical protein